MRPTDSNIESGVTNSAEPTEDIEVIADDLDIPWGMAFLPDGNMLVTERPGTLKLISGSGQSRQTFEIEGVEHAGEGGLLGVALHPEFEHNNFLYLYMTSRNGGGLLNRVERYQLVGNELTDRQVVLSNIPGANYHDGGRLAFGPDGFLYITTGDAGQESLSQNTNSLAGKILRIADDGSVPSGNPFGNPVYAYGIRNSQGLAWDDQERLWSTDHGRSGRLSGLDELNLIRAGANYGWPVIEGDETRGGMRTPVVHSGPDETWAPAGLAYWDGSLFFAGLRGQTLYEAETINDSEVRLKAHFHGEYGRLRTVKLGPEGMLYIATSNTDGRGSPEAGDDRIIRINPEIFR